MPPPTTPLQNALRLALPLAGAALLTLLTLALLGGLQPDTLQAAGTRRYVAPTGVDATACDSDSQPCATPAYALGQANAGDTIVVAPGVYTQVGVSITRSVHILGSGAGNTIVQAHADPAQATGRVFRVEGGAVVTLTDLTIRHGHASGTGDARHGGGILNLGRLRLERCRLLSNTAFYFGGGLAVLAGSVALSDTLVAGNSAGVGGGGMFVSAGSWLHLTGGQVLSNVAAGDSNGGGGIYIYAGAFTQTGASTIAYNRADNGGHGGGIHQLDGAVALGGADVHHNSSAANGGAVYVGASNLAGVTRFDMLGGQLHENSAGGAGGALFVSTNSEAMRAAAMLTGTRIVSNAAVLGGAVAQIGGGAVTLTLGCVVGNSDPAVQRLGGVFSMPLVARHTWWGSGSGPSGEGPGAGDGVAGGVDFAGFLTVPPSGCRSIDCDMSIRKTATSSTLRPGVQSVTYTIAFSNRGPAVAQDVVISDWLPGGMADVRIVVGGDPLTLALDGPGVYAWQAGNLAPGAAGRMTLSGRITPAPGAVFTNRVAMTAATFDAAPGDNRAAWRIVVGEAGGDDRDYGVHLPVVMKH